MTNYAGATATYDSAADAVYVYLAYGRQFCYSVDLDDRRHVDFDGDGLPMGVELLSVSKGVNMDGLPEPETVRAALASLGIAVREVKL